MILAVSIKGDRAYLRSPFAFKDAARSIPGGRWDPAAKSWRVATALPELGAKRYGFGSYLASNYDELIDHPFELGPFWRGSFVAGGVGRAGELQVVVAAAGL